MPALTIGWMKRDKSGLFVLCRKPGEPRALRPLARQVFYRAANLQKTVARKFPSPLRSAVIRTSAQQVRGRPPHRLRWANAYSTPVIAGRGGRRLIFSLLQETTNDATTGLDRHGRIADAGGRGYAGRRKDGAEGEEG
jgi:hypothetical protein